MARTLTAGMITEITASELEPILLVRGEFDSGDLNVWSGIGEITHDSRTYVGGGSLLQISNITESRVLEAAQMTITLAGLDPAIISFALNEDFQNRPAILDIGALDSSGNLVASPYRFFRGTMDTMGIKKGAETASVGVTVENELVDGDRIINRVWAPEDQKREYATDSGFDFVAGLVGKEIIWKG